MPGISPWKPPWQTPGLNQCASMKDASLEKTTYLKTKGTPGFIEFVPNSSTFNHPETVSLQATISFTNECLLYKIASLVLHRFIALTLHLPCVRASFCCSCLFGLLHVNETICEGERKKRKKKDMRSLQV